MVGGHAAVVIGSSVPFLTSECDVSDAIIHRSYTGRNGGDSGESERAVGELTTMLRGEERGFV